MALRPIDRAHTGSMNGHRPQARPTSTEQWAERFLSRVEHVPAFRKSAAALTSLFSRVVHPGPVKDILSGTSMGHPAHPMLTDVAIGAWTSAVMLDLFPSKNYSKAADRLIAVGLASAVPTIMTGLSDLSDSADERELSIGGAHALGNIAATMLFGLSYLMRRRGSRIAGITLSLCATGAATAAGFLGGHLAYRRGLGVDHSVFDDPLEEWTVAMKFSELHERKPTRIQIGRTDVLMVREKDEVFVLADRCSHRGGPLHEGSIENGCVRCPWHDSEFRLDDGAIVAGPATAPQPSFEVRVRNEKIEVRRRRVLVLPK